MNDSERLHGIAVGEAVILLHPPSSLVDVSVGVDSYSMGRALIARTNVVRDERDSSVVVLHERAERVHDLPSTW